MIWQHLKRSAALAGAALALAASAQGLAQGEPPYEPRYDLTANGAVDASDAAAAAGAWEAQAEGGACAPAQADLSGDGCVDVADVQLVAARVAAAPPGAKAGGQAVWTVNAARDEPDAAPGDGQCRTAGGACTLRAAIDEANRSDAPDLIVFDVRAADGSCPVLVTIVPDSQTRGLLTLDDPRDHGTTIDGYTQCGARPNSGRLRGDAVIKIELRGGYDFWVHGLRIASANNVVRGLALYAWDRQIEVAGSRAKDNHIEGNFIGTNAAQTVSSSRMDTHHSEGVRIQFGASRTVVGCGTFDGSGQFVPCADEARALAARNIVAGNGDDGIHLERQTYDNHIVGNYIGLQQDGETALKNRADGVDFEQGPQRNWLGGLTALERNVISGNSSDGIEISHGTDTQFNHVAGNIFGLDAGGTKAVPNLKSGISFEDAVDRNYATNNVVSGNFQHGFRFYILATRNELRGNIVGLAADGQTPIPNRQDGIWGIGGSQHNLISENVIAYNRGYGVLLSNTSDSDHDRLGLTYYNTISRNRIFNNQLSGIQFSGKRGTMPNQGLAVPVLARANSVRVEGTACPGCVVEVFLADTPTLARGDGNGEGMEFVGQGQADGAGRFTFDIRAVAPGQILTATATDVKGNTSMFARNIAVGDAAIGDPTPAPTLTPTPTREPAPGESPATPTPTDEPQRAGDAQVWLPVTMR